MKKVTNLFFLLLFLTFFSTSSFGQKYTGLTAVASDNKSTAEMFDNNKTTRWQDASNQDNASFVVDLGAIKAINSIKIYWEYANAKNYTISFSTDNKTFSGSLTYSNMAAGERTDVLSDINANCRYIKFQGVTRGLAYGYSIYEFEVYASDETSTLNSNLPIVIITTDNNVEIKDDPKVLATMKIIYRPNGTRNYITDQNTTDYLNYNGRIGIEFRGSSSQELPKKPYGLTTLEADNITNNNVSILGMPKENDWILNSLAYDPSLIRDYLSYELSRKMGNYASRGVYCEVVINGDYKGLYIFMEKLKIDDNRINIEHLTSLDKNITGGYVTKCDKTTGGDPVAWNMTSYNNEGVDYIHVSPKPTEITTQQSAYIHKQFTDLESATYTKNTSIINGYPSIIDVSSFIDFMIMNELSSNVDGYKISTYFHKDRNGKLKAGPIWDFNLTYGNDLFVWGLDRSHTDVWQFDNVDNTGSRFWKDLYDNSTFLCYLSKRWIELTAQNKPLNFNVISARIDELASLTAEAAVREQSKWNTISTRASNISTLKTWIQTRTNWLNTKLSNCQACSNVSVPALVISKINYNPAFSDIAVSDSLEYIEITNNSNAIVNLTGIYLKELGVTYQFPANSTISPNQRIRIASNSTVFKLFYGFAPFGQFSRNLSDKSENLTLVDAFGNVIDQVVYSDSFPWPTEADGNGSYLELADLSLDNSLASSWRAPDQTGVDNISFENAVRIYPSPAKTNITIYSNNLAVKSYEITDMMGRTVRIENDYSSNTINIEQLAPNIYLLKLQFIDGRSVVKKIIKI